MTDTYKNYLYYRNLKGKSDYQISQETGISRSTLSDWKNGRHEPLVKTLHKIAENLDIDVNAFYSGVPEIRHDFKLHDDYSIEINNSITDYSLKRMIEYTYRLSSGEKIKLSQEEYSELKNAVDIFIDSWIRSKKKL